MFLHLLFELSQTVMVSFTFCNQNKTNANHSLCYVLTSYIPGLSSNISLIPGSLRPDDVLIPLNLRPGDVIISDTVGYGYM